MRYYDYRCTGDCGRVITMDEHEKAEVDRLWVDTGERPACPTCGGDMRRVWVANVATATVPGFHKHDHAKRD